MDNQHDRNHCRKKKTLRWRFHYPSEIMKPDYVIRLCNVLTIMLKVENKAIEIAIGCFVQSSCDDVNPTHTV